MRPRGDHSEAPVSVAGSLPRGLMAAIGACLLSTFFVHAAAFRCCDFPGLCSCCGILGHENIWGQYSTTLDARDPIII
jgi:hypothetical protein